MPETAPTVDSTRLDGGHPALELVNTVYGQVGGPVEHDLLQAPEDLPRFAHRVGLADAATPAGAAALADARALRDTVDTLLRARTAHAAAPTDALAALAAAASTALAAATLAHDSEAFAWTWPSSDAHTPVHRFAHAAIELLTDECELARLRQCAGCCWLFLDHSRGAGRRWCSMEWGGTDAKKRRYVERRRRRRADSS